MPRPTVIVHYPDKATERIMTKIPMFRDCQQTAIDRFLRADLPAPADILNQDAMRIYYQNCNRMRRGYGEVCASYSITEEGDQFTWDMVLNQDHTHLDVHVFIQWWEG